MLLTRIVILGMCAAITMLGSVRQVAAQRELTTGFSLGVFHPDGYIRSVPGDSRTEPTYVRPAFSLSAAIGADIPVPRTRLEVRAGTTIGSNLMVRRFVRESCGETCTHSFQRSVEVGGAAIRAGGLDVLVNLWNPGPLRLTAAVGGGLRQYDFDQSVLPEPYSTTYAEDEWAYGFSYGARIGLPVGGVAIVADARRHRFRFSRDQPPSAVSFQRDWSLSVGARFPLR